MLVLSFNIFPATQATRKKWEAHAKRFGLAEWCVLPGLVVRAAFIEMYIWLARPYTISHWFGRQPKLTVSLTKRFAKNGQTVKRVVAVLRMFDGAASLHYLNIITLSCFSPAANGSGWSRLDWVRRAPRSHKVILSLCHLSFSSLLVRRYKKTRF